MKKKTEEPIKEVRATTPPFELGQEAESELGLNPNTVWVGSDAMRHIKEQLDESGNGFYSETEEDEVDAGARHIEEFLFEFRSMTGLRLRLIFGDAEAPLHELDISKVPSSQGVLDNDDIQKWIKAGAALIADAHDLREAA